MKSETKYRMLVWVVVVLLATNLSMGISYMYHRTQEAKSLEQSVEEKTDAPAQQRTRFFREQLNLSPAQVDTFRALNRNFNRKAWQIQNHLTRLRREMVVELGKEEINKQKLDDVTTQIGNLHIKLKQGTIEYYLAMKEACTEEQKERLNQLFLTILNENENVRLPQGGGRFRNNFQAVEQDSLSGTSKFPFIYVN